MSGLRYEEAGVGKPPVATELVGEDHYQRFGSGAAVLTAKATYTTSGDHTLITPPAGQSLRVVWLYAQAKGALDTGVVLVSFTLGSNSYEFELTGSQPFMHGAVWEGAIDAPLIVATSSTAAVLINVDYRSF